MRKDSSSRGGRGRGRGRERGGGGGRGKGGGRPSAPRRTAEVVFDEEERRAYLTGFRKRKLERRTFGLAMQMIKDRKEKLSEKKEERLAAKEKMRELGVDEDIAAYDLSEKKREGTKPTQQQQVSYADNTTTQMFGDAVTVTTTMGIVGAAEDAADDDDEELQELRRERSARTKQKQDARWSLHEVSKRVASSLPKKKSKRPRNAAGGEEKGKPQGKRAKRAGGAREDASSSSSKGAKAAPKKGKRKGG
jgi:ribosomal RNA-processing protein 17